MTSQELAEQATANARSRIQLNQESWSLTQTRINEMLGQQAMHNVTGMLNSLLDQQRRLFEFGLVNAQTKNGVPPSAVGVDQIRELLVTQQSQSVPPAAAPPTNPKPSMSPLATTLISLAAALGVGGGGFGLYQLFNQQPDPVPVVQDGSQLVADQENFLANYLQARGYHVPPESK